MVFYRLGNVLSTKYRSFNKIEWKLRHKLGFSAKSDPNQDVLKKTILEYCFI